MRFGKHTKRRELDFMKGENVMNNLNDLLSRDRVAKQYFLTLPENIQGALIQNTNEIHNADELYDQVRRMNQMR